MHPFIMHPCIQHAKGAGSMAGLQQTGTFAESILLLFLRRADCLLRLFSLRFQVIQLVAQQFLTTDSRNVGNEMWQGSLIAGTTLVHRPVPDSIPEPAFAGSMLRLQFVVSVLGPQIKPESGFASLGLHSQLPCPLNLMSAQLGLGKLEATSFALGTHPSAVHRCFQLAWPLAPTVCTT